MAYLSPTTLTCPKCGFAATVKVVIGIGPGSRRDDIPYQRIQHPAPFIAEIGVDGYETGRVLCPEDGTPVWTDIPGQRADPTS